MSKHSYNHDGRKNNIVSSSPIDLQCSCMHNCECMQQYISLMQLHIEAFSYCFHNNSSCFARDVEYCLEKVFLLLV